MAYVKYIVHVVLGLALSARYSDGWMPRWDSYGMMMERLATSVPIMTCGGNHEVGDGEAWVSYKTRYPMPFRQSGSTDGTYWSRNIGPAHVISLNSYAASKEGSLQHRWLVADLRLVDRVKTPWVIAMNHAPWCVVCIYLLYSLSWYSRASSGVGVINSVSRRLEYYGTLI